MSRQYVLVDHHTRYFRTVRSLTECISIERTETRTERKTERKTEKRKKHLCISLLENLLAFCAKTWWISMKRACMRRSWTFIRMREFLPPVHCYYNNFCGFIVCRGFYCRPAYMPTGINTAIEWDTVKTENIGNLKYCNLQDNLKYKNYL